MTAAKVIDQQRRWNRRLLISSFLFRTKLFFDGSLIEQIPEKTCYFEELFLSLYVGFYMPLKQGFKSLVSV